MSDNPNHHRIFWAFVALVSAIPALLILLLVSPDKASYIEIGGLYLSLFAFSLGFFTLILSFAHKQHSGAAVREAFLVGILIVGSLLLLSLGLLNWWLTAIFVLTLILIEIFFLI